MPINSITHNAGSGALVDGAKIGRGREKCKGNGDFFEREGDFGEGGGMGKGGRWDCGEKWGWGGMGG